ncbi:MAG TPA: hydroxyisourate hydrolase [Nevskiaceae bacterium]|nr:hydroxyisourate hydrolase [Nevskiaceae bacterium]
MSVSNITTHILDTSSGRPASGVQVRLSVRHGERWEPVANGVTDDDGRIRNLGPEQVEAGVYRLSFAVGAYFERQKLATFFPEVDLQFSVQNPAQHYHVPLLLSPFAYSTYRGS